MSVLVQETTCEIWSRKKSFNSSPPTAACATVWRRWSSTTTRASNSSNSPIRRNRRTLNSHLRNKTLLNPSCEQIKPLYLVTPGRIWLAVLLLIVKKSSWACRCSVHRWLAAAHPVQLVIVNITPLGWVTMEFDNVPVDGRKKLTASTVSMVSLALFAALSTI